MFFMRRHVKAIEDNIDMVKRVVRNSNRDRSHVNDVEFVVCISNIIRCDLYGNYHHTANRKYNDSYDRICFKTNISNVNMMFCEQLLMTENNYDRIDYQTIGFFQLRVELIKIVNYMINNRG